MTRWLAPTLLWLVACGAPPAPTAAPTETLTIRGSDTLTRVLLPEVAKAYERAAPGVSMKVEGGGDAAGFRAVLSGDADCAAAARDPFPAEEEQAIVNGYSFMSPEARHLVAVDVVAVAVHPSNSLTSLSFDQVIGIFCTQEISDWAQLGMDPSPIRVMTAVPSSSTRALFEDFFCGPRGIHTRAEQASDEDIAAALDDDPATIAYLSTAEQAGSVLGLRPLPDDRPIRPSQKSVVRGAYPLYRDLYLFTPGPPSAAASQMLDWLRSPAGQDVVDEADFVPLFLRPERSDEARPLREIVYFEPGSGQPNQHSRARLHILVDELRSRAGEYRHVILEGFTDAREVDPSGLATSRAQAVESVLKQELPGLFVEIIPRGAVQPIAPNDTPYGRQRNRRVQVYLAAEEAFEPVLSGQPTEKG